jgi:hypothetical protein
MPLRPSLKSGTAPMKVSRDPKTTLDEVAQVAGVSRSTA